MPVEIPVEVILYAQIPRILRGEEIDLTPVVEAMVSSKILDAIRASMPVPTEFEPVIDILVTLENIKSITAALRGETYEPRIDRIVELIVTLSIMETLTSALASAS